jgi:hypothetical protein
LWFGWVLLMICWPLGASKSWQQETVSLPLNSTNDLQQDLEWSPCIRLHAKQMHQISKHLFPWKLPIHSCQRYIYFNKWVNVKLVWNVQRTFRSTILLKELHFIENETWLWGWNQRIYLQQELGRTNRLLSFDMTRTAKKTVSPTFLHSHRNMFTEPLLWNAMGNTQTHLQTLLWHDMDRIKNNVSNNSSLFYVLVAIAMCLPCRFLATIGGIWVQTHRLMGVIYEVRRWDGLIPSFIKIGSGIQNLIGGDTQTHRQDEDCISLVLFFQNKESRLKNMCSSF